MVFASLIVVDLYSGFLLVPAFSRVCGLIVKYVAVRRYPLQDNCVDSAEGNQFFCL